MHGAVPSAMDTATAKRAGAVAPRAEFLLHGLGRAVHAEGCRARLPAGPAATLGARVAAFFAEPGAKAPPLVGILPFDPYQDDALYQPQRLLPGSGWPDHGAASLADIDLLTPEPAAPEWAEAVARCVNRLQPRSGDSEQLHKVVLARSLKLHARGSVDPWPLVQRLARDPGVTTYLTPLPVTAGEPPAWLVGASPELLVSRHGDVVRSNPLAGSAPRAAEATEDAAAAAALEASQKDHDEHRYVVEAILDTLAPLCRHLQAPSQPSLQATRSLWHLGTRIEGRLKDPGVSAAALAGLLHPTPAVCGTPRRQALECIRALEPVERGFYAGAVGWVDAAGDGQWYVSLRCARVQGRGVRLFAGAGIVAASQPQLEVRETGAKFTAMLEALGVREQMHGRH